MIGKYNFGEYMDLTIILSMNNYNKENINTMLKMSFNSDLTHEFGNSIPYPNNHQIISNNHYVYGWEIDGFFGTDAGIEYFNDIIARFIISFKTYNPNRFRIYKIKSKESGFFLKQFQNLKSINVNATKNFVKGNLLQTSDQVFWALKIWVEIEIKRDGFVPYDTLERYATDNFLDQAKDYSTLKAKCKSIWWYYEERDWESQLGYVRKCTNEEYKMSRSNNMKKVNKKQVDETRKKVFNCLTSMFVDDYKKRSGDWNITKIAKDSKTSRNTVYKYLDEFEKVGA